MGGREGVVRYLVARDDQVFSCIVFKVLSQTADSYAVTALAGEVGDVDVVGARLDSSA